MRAHDSLTCCTLFDKQDPFVLRFHPRSQYMQASFTLSAKDHELLERAVAARFQRKNGRLNAAFFAQMFAWMFITLAVMTFFKQWERAPETASPYGFIVLSAGLAFLLASAYPLLSRRLYMRYLKSENSVFMSEQTVEVDGESLLIHSRGGKAWVPRSAIIDHLDDERNNYLFISGIQAIVIPNSAAVALGADFSAFVAPDSDRATVDRPPR